MIEHDLERVRRMLGTPETAWLLSRMRGRLETTGLLEGRLVKTVATGAERSAAARLTGRAVRAGSAASVSLEELDKVLRSEAWPSGLASAVVALTGEVVSPHVRSAERAGWQSVNETLRRISLERDVATRDAAARWVEATIRSGALKRATSDVNEAQLLADRLALIARALPAAGESRGVFSARIAGNAHALDASTSLGTLANGLAYVLGGSISDAAPGSARWRRDSWQSVGVVVDELSSTVLTLGLPGAGWPSTASSSPITSSSRARASPTARALAALTESGQPALLTLRQLISDDIGSIPSQVFVCENPAVVAAAADRWDAGRAWGAALVCVSGQPGAAVVLLLQKLAAAGSILRYHGDFDWGGMSIARTLARHVSWQPWRFDAESYERAVDCLPGLPALLGVPGSTPWDEALVRAMVAAGLKVEEELVLDSLLDDMNGAVVARE